jgi:DNA-binding CsgD family transcriptional regulator/tetratricopeptide (TPR) repeat protein
MPLLERERQLAAMTAMLAEAATHGGRLLFIEGEAGVGKTTLLARFRDAVTPVTPVFMGRCDPLSTPHPLGPLVEIAEAFGGSTQANLRAGASRDEVFRVFLAQLSGSPAPVVVVFEDAHWADEATLDLLRYVGRRIDMTPSLVIVTYRDDEVGPNHPLRVVVGDLATSLDVRRVALPRLSEAAVGLLAQTSAIDPAELYRLTGGNPFFVTEVLQAGSGGIPTTVRDAVLARAARLSPAGRRTLEAAAVIGPTVEGWLIRATTEHPATEECVARGVLLADGPGYAFRHEIARTAILDSIDPSARTGLHARVLAALRGLPEADWPVARMAHHAEEAGDGDAVLVYAQEAARRAVALESHREAAGQLARAVRFADRLPPNERADLFEAYGHEHNIIDRSDLAIRALRDAVAIWRAAGNRQREGGALAQLATNLVASGMNRDADAAAQAAVDLLEPLPNGPEKVHALSARAFLLMLDRYNREALEVGHRAIKAGRGIEGATAAVVSAHNSVGCARILLGDDGGREDLEESLRLAQAAGYHRGVAGAWSNLGTSFGEMYRFDIANECLAKAVANAIEYDNDRARYYAEAWRAVVKVHQGRWAEAAERAARVLARPNLASWSRIMANLALGRLRARRGDPGAWDALDEALALSEPTGTLQRLGPVRAARAEAAWLDGEPERAASEASAVLPLAIDRRHPWHMGELSYWLAKSGAPAPMLDGIAAPYALQLTGRWAEAAKAWEALRCPYEAARALLDGDSVAAVERAHATFVQLGARPAEAMAAQRMRELGVRSVRRGPRPATRRNPAGLTARELEVVQLVAGGMRNDEIARRLFLSSRTVDHHVAAVLAKLEVERRGQVAEAAARLGIRPQFGQSTDPE